MTTKKNRVPAKSRSISSDYDPNIDDLSALNPGENGAENIVNLNDPSLFINREITMLRFQERVLEEAKDKRHPLLERIKFLAILGSNLDEFFMVRVGGLRMQIDEGIIEFSIDGLTPAQQMAEIRKVAYRLLEDARTYYREELHPELRTNGIHILNYSELNEKQLVNIQEYFDNVIFPVLTPLAYDPGHPFPHISNLSLNLAITIKDEKGIERFARLKIPQSLSRLVPIKRSSGSIRRDGTVPHHHYFVWIEQVIVANLEKLFPGMQIIAAYPFRVTRNADFEIQDLEADDLLESMEESVRERRFGTVIRLAVNKTMPDHILNILINNLEMDPKDVYRLDEPLGFSNFSSLMSVDRYDLKDIPYQPSITPQIPNTERLDGNIFNSIIKGDILLHHPYDSFTPVIEFIRQAARDPNVLAIKTTLYRVGRNSPIVKALLEARRDYGKQVAVLVELKARFDEESNIEWARMLEQEGVHVTYGLVGLKTHSKLCLVVRKEGEAIRRYMHLGTGNYNHNTANIYEDFGLFTCDDQFGSDVTHVFNYLTGYSNMRDYKKLLVAPINLREKMEQLIIREIEHQKTNGNGRIIFKMNALLDKKIIRLLYQASIAGVKVDLLIRGLCSLRPGVTGVSENIRVISILGRYLEHSRVYYFHNSGQEEMFMGSADLMPRNLNRRVEVLFPIERADMVKHIRENILEVYLKDNAKARFMESNGQYTYIHPEDNTQLFEAQSWFMKVRENNLREK